MLKNADGTQPPTAEGAAKEWLLQLSEQGIDLSGVTVVADPNYSMVAGGGSFGTPMLTVVDPRNMQVVHSHQGYKGPANMDEVEGVASKNKIP